VIFILVKFEIYHDGAYWCARSIGGDADIFTQGPTMDDLMTNIREAVELQFEDVLRTGTPIQVLTFSEIEVPPLA